MSCGDVFVCSNVFWIDSLTNNRFDGGECVFKTNNRLWVN